MSIKQYPGGIVTKNPTAPAGPYQDGAAPGVWTLDQVANYIKEGIWPLAGNTNPNAFIENLFSTYLYTGNASSQTIANNIDVSTKGGLVWIKNRSTTASHYLFDTARGSDYTLNTNSTSSQGSGWSASGFFNPGFLTNGFGIGSDSTLNGSGSTYASWTFRKQPKFFDIVTYSGSNSDQTITHNLGSVPGCIIIKNLSGAANWAVYHRSLTNPNTYRLFLNTADAQGNYGANFISNVTSTSFDVAGGSGYINVSGNNFVAYLFAHNAGGFGLTGTDNVITCGSFTTDVSWNATVNLGYEPQFILYKSTSYADNWYTIDTMRGWNVSNGVNYISPNLTNAEANYSTGGYPTATGFQINTGNANSTYIYIAIRRGPMAVPTTGTSVFAPVTYTGNATARTLTTNFPVDLNTSFYRPGYSGNTYFMDRLRGSNISGSAASLLSSSTAAEGGQTGFGFASNTGIQLGTSAFNGSGETYINYMMQRAPSFFDEVCYTGTGSLGNTLTHNLGVVPQLMIVKARAGGPSSGAGNWVVYTATTGNTSALYLNASDSVYTGDVNYWNNTSPTSTQFTVGLYSSVNGSAETYVAYLFATCPGVSKVGSYTGTGTLTTINCGFTGGARFVMIKRTDASANWFVWDTARGMVSGTDPSLSLNTTSAESNANSVYTITTGFQLLASTSADVNTNGGTYIYLAIA